MIWASVTAGTVCPASWSAASRVGAPTPRAAGPWAEGGGGCGPSNGEATGGTGSTPGAGPATAVQKPVRYLLEPVVEEAGAAELQPGRSLPAGASFLPPAHPHRIGQAVERVEAGQVLHRDVLGTKKPGVVVGDEVHPG